MTGASMGWCIAGPARNSAACPTVDSPPSGIGTFHISTHNSVIDPTIFGCSFALSDCFVVVLLQEKAVVAAKS